MPEWKVVYELYQKTIKQACDDYVINKLHSFKYQESSSYYRPTKDLMLNQLNNQGDFYTGICQDRKNQLKRFKMKAIDEAILIFDHQAKKKPQWKDVLDEFCHKIHGITMAYVDDIVNQYYYFEEINEHAPTIETLTNEIENRRYLFQNISRKKRPQLKEHIDLAVNNAIEYYHQKVNQQPKWENVLKNFREKIDNISKKFVDGKLRQFYYVEEIEDNKPTEKDIIDFIKNREDLHIGINTDHWGKLEKEIETAATKAIEYYYEEGNQKLIWKEEFEKCQKRINKTSIDCAKAKLDEFHYKEEMKNHLPSKKWIIDCIKNRKDTFNGIIGRENELEEEIEFAANKAIDYFNGEGNLKPKWSDVLERFRKRIDDISMECARTKLAEFEISGDIQAHEPKIEWIKGQFDKNLDLYNEITTDKQLKLHDEIESAARKANKYYWEEAKKKANISSDCCIA